jgi:adenylate cyclase
MDSLSECVQQYDGVLVDYIGDELMAMWGAPLTQPDHATLACQAALAMQAQIPSINRQWRELLGEEFDLGIGINSGEAQVGNTGSQYKFKYGPLGNAVNLASRVQGATKHLRTRLLITEHTASRLKGAINVRRIRKVRVANIDEPVDLYDLHPDEADYAALKSNYETALQQFEGGDFSAATQSLAALLSSHPRDIASKLLRAAAANAEINPDQHQPILMLTK